MTIPQRGLDAVSSLGDSGLGDSVACLHSVSLANPKIIPNFDVNADLFCRCSSSGYMICDIGALIISDKFWQTFCVS